VSVVGFILFVAGLLGTPYFLLTGQTFWAVVSGLGLLLVILDDLADWGYFRNR